MRPQYLCDMLCHTTVPLHIHTLDCIEDKVEPFPLELSYVSAQLNLLSISIHLSGISPSL